MAVADCYGCRTSDLYCRGKICGLDKMYKRRRCIKGTVLRTLHSLCIQNNIENIVEEI